MSNALNNLPPELQARIAQIMAGQAPADPTAPAPAAPTPPAPVAAPQQPAAPVVKPPSLMDHVIALRQEVAALRNEVRANSDVVGSWPSNWAALPDVSADTPKPCSRPDV